MIDFKKVNNAIFNNKPIIITDKKNEYEADMVFPSEKINKEIISFMILKGKGLLCTVADESYLLDKGFFKMPTNNKDKLGTNYFISLDYKLTDTGISAQERSDTIKFLANEKDISFFKYPGHVQLLGSKPFNIRKGHTESSVELLNMAGFSRFSTIIEILDDKGDSHNFEYIHELAKKYDLPVVSVEDIFFEYVIRKNHVFKEAKAKLPTEFGDFDIISFKNNLDNREHFALVKGNLYNSPITVRIHSECITGDAIHSLKCDCGSQLANSMKIINELGKGIIIYLRQEGRDIGLNNKIKAYALQDQGVDTYDANEIIGLPADARDYSIAAEILRLLEVNNIILLTNNPDKVKQIEKYGISVEKSESILGNINEINYNYLKTKNKKFSHNINL